MSKAMTGEFCGCMAGPNDPDPKCSECGGTGKPSHEWQLVPKKADVGMLAAWYRYKNGHHFHDEPAPRDTSDVGAWAAMLAAAPTPPAVPGEVERLPYDMRVQIGRALDRLVCDDSTPEQVDKFIATFSDFGLRIVSDEDFGGCAALSAPVPLVDCQKEIEGGDKGDGWQPIETAPVYPCAWMVRENERDGWDFVRLKLAADDLIARGFEVIPLYADLAYIEEEKP